MGRDMTNHPRIKFSFFPKPWALLGLGLALSVCLGGGVQAQTVTGGDALSSFEQSLFSHDYAGETLSGRLARLEISVFGEVQAGSEPNRQARLLQALTAARNVIPNAPKAPSGKHSEESSAGINRFNPFNASGGNNDPATSQGDGPDDAVNSSSTPPSSPPGDSDYPTVTALEREVFSRDFIRDDISRRLDRLENRAFGQNNSRMALVDRVDRLLARYPNASSQVARYAGGPGEDSGSSTIQDLPSDSGQFVGKTDTYAKVGAMEQRFFNGKSYSGELLSQRLDRLESQAYGRAYAGESVDTRVNRLLGAYRVAPKRRSVANDLLRQPDPAKWQSPPAVGYSGSFLSSSRGGNSAYNNSGGYASSSSSTSYGTPPAANQGMASKNVQIGSGFSSTSTSSYGFSPEMMSMLPPNMQQQLAGTAVQQQQQSSSTTVVGAPGTVITQQSTTYPGFQTYGGPPIQTYNYYGNPGGGQTQSTTTVIQPDGSQLVTTNYPGGSTLPANPNGLPNPAYVGDPVLLQNLGNLELNVYGQVDMTDPVYVRLGKLENAMLGQVYQGYPDAQRLANLQKAYQLQSVGRLLGKGKAANLGRTAGSLLFGMPMNTPGASATPLIAPGATTPPAH
jgi:hypothetical protein